MPLILRIDVDKPYGSSGLTRRIISKLSENAWFPSLEILGYDRTSRRFARFLHQESIPAIFFFRLCTLPSQTGIREYLKMGHVIGLHAENTRSEATFLKEVAHFQHRSGLNRVTCFSKHGSGVHKLGRRHYAPYEENKYREWDQKHGIRFPFGNGMISSENYTHEEFFKEVFWMHPSYRDTKTFTVEWAMEQARQKTLAVLVHPENYYTVPQVKQDFDRLIAESKQQNIPWMVQLP